MLSAASPEIREFVRAYQVNRNLGSFGHPEGSAEHDWLGYRIIAKDRSKYIAIDESDRKDSTSNLGAGRFLIDKSDGTVYSIKAYGQRNYRLGNVAGMTERFEAANASFDPSSHIRVGSPNSPMTTDRAAIRETLASHRSSLRGRRGPRSALSAGTPHPAPPSSRPTLTVLQGGRQRRRRIRRSARP
jgi:hypothetical protein